MASTLSRTLKGIQNNEVLIPIIETMLADPEFQGFTVEIEPWESRPPDGYFHPSTHATWNTRQLALYLMAPHLVDVERMSLKSVFAITQGHFWHLFIQHLLGTNGIMTDSEVGFTDEEHKRRGHIDGILNVKGEAEGLEIKTINMYKIGKMTDEAALKELKFGYWSQAQEYLDVFGLKVMRFLFLCPTYPFDMKEFTVKADEVHQGERRRDYRRAFEMAESGPLPLTEGTCCGNLQTCPTRYACQFKG